MLLKCGIKDMTQMKIGMKERKKKREKKERKKEKLIHGLREQICGFQGRENWGRDEVRG